MLSTPKIITLLAVSLSKLLQSVLLSIIPYSLYTYSLSLLLTILVDPNKEFLNLKLLVGFRGYHLIHKQCKHLQFWSSNCFAKAKGSYYILIKLRKFYAI